ncbi:caspase family protein [Streptomyces sp. NPDC020096]
MARCALVLGSHTFTDSRLDRLRSPEHDVSELSRALADPEIGRFAVTSADNPTGEQLRQYTREFFESRDRDDVLLLYYTGHGIREGDELFLAGSDADLDALADSALSATLLKHMISACRAKRIVLLLDCCYSGAFAHKMVPMSEPQVHIQEFFGGHGLTLITATTAREYAFEAGTITDEAPRPSVFTSELIRGLETGAADLDGDGEITLDELYQFLFDAVQLAHPGLQTPCRWVYGGRGRMVIALRRPGPRPQVATALPPDPVRLVTARRQAVAMVPAAAAGGLALWWAWRQDLMSLGFVGGFLLAAAAARMANCLFGATTLATDGVHVRSWRRSRLPWVSLLAIECRTTLFGTTVAVHRADTAVARRLVLPAPVRLRPFHPVGFADDVETIQQWTLRRGSPAPVHHHRMLLPLRNTVVITLAALTLLTGFDHPWTRGHDLARTPRACAVLNEATAATLSPTWFDGPETANHVDSTSQQGSTCAWQYAVLGGIGDLGLVTLTYTRYQTDAEASGAIKARQQVSQAERDERHKDSAVSRPRQFAANGGFTGKSKDGSTIVVVAAYDNITVTLTFKTTAEQLPLPMPEQLLGIESRALAALKHG